MDIPLCGLHIVMAQDGLNIKVIDIVVVQEGSHTSAHGMIAHCWHAGIVSHPRYEIGVIQKTPPVKFGPLV
jgi:hypothetical protein